MAPTWAVPACFILIRSKVLAIQSKVLTVVHVADYWFQGGLNAATNKSSDSSVESRYSADYESRLDPFTTFSQRVCTIIAHLEHY